MSAFLQRLAARSLSALPLLEPRRSSRFEPADAPPVAGETPVLASGRKPEPEPQDPEPAGRVPETRPPGPAPASKDTLDQDRASPQPSPRPNATDAPGAPPRVILQLREAPRLVVEPPLPPASGPAAFPAPFPTPEPPLPLLESRPAPQLLARLPQGQPVVSPGPRRAAAGPVAAPLPAMTREDVHISIGRIEIKAVLAPGSTPRPRPASNGTPSGLDTYLQQRGRTP